MERQKARLAILKAANKNRVSETLPPYQMRHLQRAVNRVRNLGLVSPQVLVDAGFNYHGPNHRVKR